MKTRVFLLLCALYHSGPVVASEIITIKNQDKATAQTAQKLINEVLSITPSSITKILDKKTISLEFSDLNSKYKESTLPNPCQATGFKYGNYNLGKIKIDQRFLNINSNYNEISGDDFDCKHRSYRKMLIASILHEFAHAYDNKFLWAKRGSNDLVLRNLGYWKTDKLSEKNLNTFHKRSPDDYEYEKRREFFAVNFEYFILDSEYKCRRPELYNYFSKELNHIPFKNVTCQTDRKISLTTDNGVKSVELNSRKVKEIQFLFAAEGPQMFSKWGHSMFKLIVCKDENDSLEECRKNSNDHVVISFLAYIDELNIDALKGVFGKYPSRMLVSDLGAIKRQYTRGEFRSLKAIPLKFSEIERERFLTQILRVYWEYAGKYYFFANNCADEAFKLIQAAYQDKKIYKKDVLTPSGLYKFLIENKIASDEVLKNESYAINNGYFYPSFGISLNKVYSTILENFKTVAMPESVEKYTTLHPMERRVFIENLMDKASDKKQLFQIMSIEGHGQYIDAQRVLKAMTDFKSIDRLSDEYKKMLEESVELKNTFLYGKTSSEMGYGIPLIDEIIEDMTVERTESDIKREAILQAVKDEIKRMNSKEFKRYEDSVTNLNIIKNRIKELK